MRASPAAAAIAVVLITLMVCAVSPFSEATLVPDTVRDLSASLRLSRGEAWPLAGPAINFGPPLGPAWIRLQALPLLVSGSLAAVSLFVAAIAAVKYWFLYQLGRRWEGPALGIAVAASAAFPSLAIYQWHMLLHPNWVETAIAGALLVTLMATLRRSIGLWYVSCLMLGLAVQLHPTALFYLPVLLFAVTTIETSRIRWLVHACGALLAIAVWFAPLAFVPRFDHGQGAGAVASRISAGLQTFRFADLATVLRTAYFDIPIAVGDTYAPYAGFSTLLWRVLLAAVWLGVAFGLMLIATTGSRRTRVLAAAVFLALALGWIIVCAIRTYTPFYLCYFMLPLTATLMGLAINQALTSSAGACRAIGVVAITAMVACAAIASAGAVRMSATGEIDSRLPALSDLKHPGTGHIRARLLGVAVRDEIARFLCGQGPRVTVHGDLAFALAASTNLDMELHCPGHTDVTLMGNGGWTVISSKEESAMGRHSALAFRGLRLFPVVASYPPGNARQIERNWYQFDELHDPKPVSHFAAQFTTSAGAGPDGVAAQALQRPMEK